MGQTDFCKNLRFLAVFCKNLRFPAVLCENLHLRSAVNPRKSENLQKSAKICGKLQKIRFGLSYFPKDPAVLKILRRSKFALRSQFAIA